MEIPNVIHFSKPFILQFGDKREVIQPPAHLEFAGHVQQVRDEHDTFFNPERLPSRYMIAQQELKLFINDELAYLGANWGVNEAARLLTLENGAVEIHLDPKYIHAVI